MGSVQKALTIPRRDQQFAAAEVKQLPQSGTRLAAIGVAAVLAILIDGTAANVVSSGLPYLQGVLAATPDQASWILTVFNAAYYATIFFSPWLYARFGRKPLLLGALVGFGGFQQIGADGHGRGGADQPQGRHFRRVSRGGFQRDQRPHGMADQFCL